MFLLHNVTGLFPYSYNQVISLGLFQTGLNVCLYDCLENTRMIQFFSLHVFKNITFKQKLNFWI